MTAASLSPEVCFIDRLSEADRNSLLLLGRARTYSGRSIVFFEDDESGSVFVVRSGVVKLSLVVDDHEVVLDLLGPGDVLGEISAIDGLVRGATATTLIEVELCVIPAIAFMEFVAERPAVMLELVRSIAGRLRSASRRQVESGALDATGRVCRRLVEMVERFGQPVGSTIVIAGPLTQNDVAAWAGLSREAVVKALRSMRRVGWVTTNPRSITVHDVHAFRSRAGLGPPPQPHRSSVPA
jgi:CRP/FNR family transcriptional regulator, cyclic AMP receptor protein